MNLLGENEAIVLCGHLHKTSVLTRSTPKGNFVQICTGSVIESPDAPIKDHLKGVDPYGANLLELEPNFAAASFQERKENLEKEKPFIKHFEYAHFMGYSTVSVSSKQKLEISIFRNMDTKPWQVIDVNRLLEVYISEEIAKALKFLGFIVFVF